MNHKRIYASFLLATALQPSYSRDNSRFYVNIGAEYALPTMGRRGFEDHYFYDYMPPSAGGQVVLLRGVSKKTSFGDGLWLNGNIGYYIVNNIALDLGVQLGMTKKEKVGIETIEPIDVKTITTYVKHPLILTPSIKYRYPVNSSFNLHGRVGVVLPLITRLYIDEWTYPSYLRTSEIKTKFSPGFTAGIGGEYKIVNDLWLSAELSFVSLNVDSKEKTIKTYTIDGQDYLKEIPEWLRTTYYEDEAAYFTGNLQNPTKVIQNPFEIPFSRIGLKLGFSYYF